MTMPLQQLYASKVGPLIELVALRTKMTCAMLVPGIAVEPEPHLKNVE